MNVPVALAVLALTPGLIPESRSESETRTFDIAGAVTVTAGLSLLVYAIVDAESVGWGSARTIGLLAAAVLLLGAFTAIERRSEAPLVPFSIFRKRTLTGANAVGLMVGGSLFAMFFFITLYMQQVLDYSPIKAGLSYLPLSIAIILSAGVASQLVTKIGFKPVLAVGLVFVAAGLFWFGAVSVDGGFATDILGPSLLAAVGLGFAFVTTTIAAVSGIEDREQGLASGLINTSQQIGGALGLAILATVANTRTDNALADAGGKPSALPGALVEGFQAAFLGAALIALIGLGADARADPQQRQPGARRADQAGPRRASGGVGGARHRVRTTPASVPNAAVAIRRAVQAASAGIRPLAANASVAVSPATRRESRVGGFRAGCCRAVAPIRRPAAA